MNALDIVMVVTVGLVMGLPMTNYIYSKDPAGPRRPLTTAYGFVIIGAIFAALFVLAENLGWLESLGFKQIVVVVFASLTYVMHILLTKTAHNFNVYAYLGGAMIGISSVLVGYIINF